MANGERRFRWYQPTPTPTGVAFSELLYEYRAGCGIGCGAPVPKEIVGELWRKAAEKCGDKALLDVMDNAEEERRLKGEIG